MDFIFQFLLYIWWWWLYQVIESDERYLAEALQQERLKAMSAEDTANSGALKKFVPESYNESNSKYRPGVLLKHKIMLRER